MEIISPYAKPLDLHCLENGINLLRKIEWCARISHRSEEAQTDTSWERFIKSVVLTHGDWSVTEHVHVTVDAIVDRGITHEWVRHRIGAYTQESTRFINYAKKNTYSDEFVNPMKFICPPSIQNKQFTTDKNVYDMWVRGRIADEIEYRGYIASGVKPQEARSCLPNALASRLIATYNLRMWRSFFLMRTTIESHPQMREVTIPLLQEFKEKIPLLYDDIEPESHQYKNVNKQR